LLLDQFQKKMAAKEEAKKNKESNPEAEAKNWEDRVRTEQEAPHRWAETWGELFDNGVPHTYDERIKHLESKLEKMPKKQDIPKYGHGNKIHEVSLSDHKRKKFVDEGKFEE
jgi:hypothetical protein